MTPVKYKSEVRTVLPVTKLNTSARPQKISGIEEKSRIGASESCPRRMSQPVPTTNSTIKTTLLVIPSGVKAVIGSSVNRVMALTVKIKISVQT